LQKQKNDLNLGYANTHNTRYASLPNSKGIKPS